MVMGLKNLLFVAGLIHTAAFGQVNFSPRLLEKEFKLEAHKMQLSIRVNDSLEFKEKYAGKILIHRGHPNSGCFVISIVEHEALEEMKKDSNILFVDSHRPAVEESALDLVNTSFNRITSARNFFP